MLLIALALATFGLGVAMGQDTCASKAVDKNGKALTGAAKTSLIQKCKRDACSAKAVDKNGKALAGAAKSSFMQKMRTGGVSQRSLVARPSVIGNTYGS